MITSGQEDHDQAHPGRAEPVVPGGTRERLLEAALRLFAEHGFASVSVGQIEQEVGLVPRRGALYRHFNSKEALLEAAVEAHLASVAAARSRFAEAASLGPGDAAELARWVLGEMDRQHHITLILEREGDRLESLRERFRRDLSDAGYTGMAQILAGWLTATGESGHGDLEALGVLLLGALVNVRRSAWTMAAQPLDVADDRLASAWARICAATVQQATRC